MKAYKSIKINLRGELKTILFGMPNSEEELDKMYELRYKVYVKKEAYIPDDESLEEREIDEYDRINKCHYFIAEIDGKIIGSARIITISPPPTRTEYYEFKEPSEIKKMSSDEVCEIGRLISIKYSEKVYLPRHLILLGLISSMLDFSRENNIKAGYGTIKGKALKSILELGLPVHVINKKELIYDPEKSHDPLSNFFNDPNRPVYLIYYLREEVENYVDSILNNKLLFKKLGENIFLFKNAIVVKFIYSLRRSLKAIKAKILLWL